MIPWLPETEVAGYIDGESTLLEDDSQEQEGEAATPRGARGSQAREAEGLLEVEGEEEEVDVD